MDGRDTQLMPGRCVRQQEEAASPPRSSMVDLRPRGRRAAASGHSLGLNLDLPRSLRDDRNMTRENQTEPCPELLLPQRLGSAPSLPVPQRCSFQPPAESGPLPAGSACQKEPSTWQPFIEGVEQREQGGVSEEGGAKEQSMYCKDELRNDGTEFSFEELRAQRYFKRKRLELDEELKQLNAEQEQLRQQLEEKQRLLQLRRTPQEAPAGAAPFQIYDEPQAESAAAVHPGHEASDDVFLRPEERGLCVKVQFPRRGGSAQRSHCKVFVESSESLTEDLIVSGHQNKTLCSSPDNTDDFAGAAKMASTPYGGPAGQRTAAHTGGPGGMTEELRNKLSPIQEASMEAGSSAGNPSSVENQENPEDQEGMELAPSAAEAAMLDPCSLDVRRRLLDHMTLTSCPGLHSELRPLPSVEEDSALLLGSEVFLVQSKLVDGGGFCIYTGVGQQGDVIIKVDSVSQPWDFHMCSRLQQNQPDGPLPAQISCFLFPDGCVTVYSAPPQHTLTEVSELQWEAFLHPVVVCLLQLVRKLHDCRLLHAALHTHTLICTHRDFSSLAAVFPADWSASVDLQLQQEVTSVQQLPSARKYISLGLLEPTAPPQQVDLVGVAEVTHFLLTQRSMKPVRDEGGWTVELSPDRPWRTLWTRFFRSLLNPGSLSSVSVLSDLLQLMKQFPA